VGQPSSQRQPRDNARKATTASSKGVQGFRLPDYKCAAAFQPSYQAAKACLLLPAKPCPAFLPASCFRQNYRTKCYKLHMSVNTAVMGGARGGGAGKGGMRARGAGMAGVLFNRGGASGSRVSIGEESRRHSLIRRGKLKASGRGKPEGSGVQGRTNQPICAGENRRWARVTDGAAKLRLRCRWAWGVGA